MIRNKLLQLCSSNNIRLLNNCIVSRYYTTNNTSTNNNNDEQQKQELYKNMIKKEDVQINTMKKRMKEEMERLKKHPNAKYMFFMDPDKELNVKEALQEIEEKNRLYKHDLNLKMKKKSKFAWATFALGVLALAYIMPNDYKDIENREKEFKSSWDELQKLVDKRDELKEKKSQFIGSIADSIIKQQQNSSSSNNVEDNSSKDELKKNIDTILTKSVFEKQDISTIQIEKRKEKKYGRI